MEGKKKESSLCKRCATQGHLSSPAPSGLHPVHEDKKRTSSAVLSSPMALGATIGVFLGTCRTVRVLSTSCRHSSRNSISISRKTSLSSAALSSVMSAIGLNRGCGLATTAGEPDLPPAIAVASPAVAPAAPVSGTPVLAAACDFGGVGGRAPDSSGGSALRKVSATSTAPPLTCWRQQRERQTRSEKVGRAVVGSCGASVIFSCSFGGDHPRVGKRGH